MDNSSVNINTYLKHNILNSKNHQNLKRRTNDLIYDNSNNELELKKKILQTSLSSYNNNNNSNFYNFNSTYSNKVNTELKSISNPKSLMEVEKEEINSTISKNSSDSYKLRVSSSFNNNSHTNYKKNANTGINYSYNNNNNNTNALERIIKLNEKLNREKNNYSKQNYFQEKGIIFEDCCNEDKQ